MANRLAKLEKAYRRNPDSPLFARIADLYLKRGQTEEALEVCLRGCQHFPDYATGFMVLAQCYEVQGAIEQARDAIDQSLRLDPVNPRGYCRLSAIYQKLGVPTLALKSLQQAAELDPLADDLPSQVDELAYKVRLETARGDERGSVEPFVDSAAASASQVLADEPFAQVSPQGEEVDEPDISAALEENEQQHSAPFDPEPSPVGAVGDDAPAAPAADTDLAEDDAAAGDDGDGWVRYESTQEVEAGGADDGESEEEISIFSPDNLPEDADVSQPPPSGLPAAAAGIQMPEIDEEEDVEAEASAASPVDAAPPEPVQAEQAPEEDSGDRPSDAERQPPVSGRYGEFDRETFAAVLSALKGTDPPGPSTAASGDDGGEPSGAPAAADGADGVVAEEAAPRNESVQEIPPVDFGSLIAAMEGMGSEPRPSADTEWTPEASLAEDDEPFVLRDDSAPETVEDDEPFVLRDDSAPEAAEDDEPFVLRDDSAPEAAEDDEPFVLRDDSAPEAAEDDEPFVLRDDSAPETVEDDEPFVLRDDSVQADDSAELDGELVVVDPVIEDRSALEGEDREADPLDLSDLRPPAQQRRPAKSQPPIDAQGADEELGPASDAVESADEVMGRGSGLRARGDDELLRLFQEIETQGRDDDDGALELGSAQASAERDEPEKDEDRQRITTLTLAEIYAIQGLNQKAIETYRDLLEQDPENDFIRRKLQELENNSGKK